MSLMTDITSLVQSRPALLFDRSERLRMQFSGPKAAESLTGLVTNDVLALGGGMGLYACALTVKGRIIADVRILAVVGADGTVETLLADTNAAAGSGFSAMIRKYVNPRTTKYVDITGATSCLTLVEASADGMLRSLVSDSVNVDAVTSGPTFTHREVMIGGVTVRVVSIPDLGAVPAYDLHVAREHAGVLQATLLAAGAAPGDQAEWHSLRVSAGRPEWGIDMDEGTLAQEANMDALEAISYQKGCYTGQETVARVHFRGHVNRTLRRVRFPGVLLPAPGTPLAIVDGSVVGDARSSCRTVDGSGIGIVMLRREVADQAPLTWTSADVAGAQEAVVMGTADA